MASRTKKRIFASATFMDYSEFSQYFTIWYTRLVRFCVMYISVEADAEDIVQNCFVKLWEKKYKIDEVSVGAILFTMARNSCYNYLKHKMVITNFENVCLQNETIPGATFENDFFGIAGSGGVISDVNTFIRGEIERLPERCRKIFKMSRYDGLSNKQIADTLGISQPAVHKNIERAIRILKRKID